jgi:uncharacterized protein (TIGR03083 family)
VSHDTDLPLPRRLELLAHDTEVLASVLEASGVSVRVPSCPDWALGDLAYHVGEVHRFWTWIARERVQDPQAADRPEVADPDDADLADWLRAGASDLIGVLRDAEPSTAVWSWTPQHDMAFIQRRMPHETSVHRWDAEDAVGRRDAAVDADLAADGVSEYFFLATAEEYTGDGRIALRATDTGHEWTGWVADGQMHYELGVAQAPATLVGTASDLLLTLWRRRGPADPRVQLVGDRAAAEAFLALANLD